MVGAEPAEVHLTGVDLRVEPVDQAQARAERPGPGLGQSEPSEQLAAGHPEQVRH
jgi:hypothetical protein